MATHYYWDRVWHTQPNSPGVWEGNVVEDQPKPTYRMNWEVAFSWTPNQFMVGLVTEIIFNTETGKTHYSIFVEGKAHYFVPERLISHRIPKEESA